MVYIYNIIHLSFKGLNHGVSQDSKTGRPKIFLVVAKYFRGRGRIKSVFGTLQPKTVAIKHMCWSDKAIIVFLNSGFKLLTSVLYARIIIMGIHKHGEFVYAQISHIQAYLTCF